MSTEKFDNRGVAVDKQVIQQSVLAREENQDGPFRVLARKKMIERYKCSSCHTEKEVTVNQGLELTHGDVAIEHGREGQALSCIDCHHQDDRDFLEDKKGKKIDFDHSYQLCGQCHFRQKRDWLGGAHGKRVANWAGERVVYNCTTCHNPHSPRFAKAISGYLFGTVGLIGESMDSLKKEARRTAWKCLPATAAEELFSKGYLSPLPQAVPP